MYLAAVDVGSNSIRHLVVQLAQGVLRYVESSARITRIAEGLGRQDGGELGEAGVERSLSALSEIRGRLDKFEIEDSDIKLFATESLRKAVNSAEIKNSMEKIFSSHLRILSGEEEARTGFKGVSTALDDANVLFDLGGGSLEISGEKDFFSFPLGAVRLMTDFGEDVPAIKRAVKVGIAGVPGLRGPLAGIGGTSSSIAMMTEGISVSDYHSGKIHGRLIRKSEIKNLIDRVISSGPQRESMVGLEPGRADIIVAGMAIIESVMEAVGVEEYQHSECGILWGVLVSMLEDRGVKVKGISFKSDAVFDSEGVL